MWVITTAHSLPLYESGERVLWQRLQVSAQICARPLAGGAFGLVPSALSMAGEAFAATAVELDCEPVEDLQPVTRHASRHAPAVRERSCTVGKRFMIVFL